MNSQNYKKIIKIVLIVVVVLLIVFCVVIFKSHPKKVMPIEVTVATVKQQNVPVYLSALGTVTPVDIININTQVDGILTQVYFQDGQRVKAGDVLAEVDPRIYQAQVTQFEGQLARDQALLENAKVDLKRYQNLYQNKDVSQQTLNTQQSLVIQYQGAIKMDEGQLEQAKINLGYCTITSPVSGRIGIGPVSAGSFLQASNATTIGVVTSLDPIEVLFPLTEEDISKVSEPFNAGQKLEVDIYNRDQSEKLATGILIAIDNLVNISTGTVQFEALVPNAQNKLFANQFVNVALKVKTLENAMTVPTEAIQQGEQGAYVFRVNQDQTVSVVLVKIGETYNGVTVINSGLNNQESVVTNGTDQLIDGTKIALAGNGA